MGNTIDFGKAELSVDEALKNLGKFNDGVRTSVTEVDKLVKEFDDLQKKLSGATVPFSELTKAQQKSTELSKRQTTLVGARVKQLTEEERISKKLTQAQQNLALAQSKQGKELAKVREETNRVNRENRLLAKSGADVSSAYQRVSAELTITRNRAKNLAAQLLLLEQSGKKNTKEYKLLEAQYKRTATQANRLDKSVKGIDSALGQNQRNVGNYASTLGGLAKNLIGAFGVVSGITLFAKVLKGSFTQIVQTEKAIAKLAAVSGSSVSGISKLVSQARELGATTLNTTREILSLQTELSKLGFSQDEILNSTQAIQKFAFVLDADLGQAAKLTGVALRAFGLDATEAGRVTSTLAVATTKSALSFEDFETAISTFAPVAKAFGLTIEDATALLGKLKDAGFDASSSSTALRNIILKLADSNSKLSKALGGSVNSFDELIPAMISLREKGVDLNDTLQLTDQRSVAAFNQLLQTAEGARVLRDEITDAGAALQVMADTQLDTVSAKIGFMQSAWEGLVDEFYESRGVFSQVFEAITTGISSITTLLGGAKSAAKAEIAEINKLAEPMDDLIFREKFRTDEIDKRIKKLKEERKELVENSKKTTGFLLANPFIKIGEEAREEAEKVNEKIILLEEERASAQEKINNEIAKQDTKSFAERIKKSEDYETAVLERDLRLAKNIIDNNLADAKGLAVQKERVRVIEQEIQRRDELAKLLKKEDAEADGGATFGGGGARKEQVSRLPQISTEALQTKEVVGITASEITKEAEDVTKRIIGLGIATKEQLIQIEQELLMSQLEVVKNKLENEALTNEQRLELSKRFYELQEKLNETAVEDEKKLNESRVEAFRILADTMYNIAENTGSEIAGALGTVAENFSNLIEDLGDTTLTNLEKTAKTAEATLASIGAIGNAIFDEQRNRADEESERNEERRQEELARVEGNKAEEERVNRIYDEKAKQEKIKKDKANRNQALFNIAISTAQGVAAALGQIPPNIPLSIAIGAIGLAQAVAVKSKPLPKYATGLDKAKQDHVGIIGDAGAELLFRKDGSVWLSPDEPTAVQINKGDSVKTASETQQMLNNLMFGSLAKDEQKIIFSTAQLERSLERNNMLAKKQHKLQLLQIKATQDLGKRKIGDKWLN